MTRTAADALRSRAHLRMTLLAGNQDMRTVAGVENRTSMNDARTALCVAMGVDLEDIDPATGHDYSRRSYDSVRASWVRHIEMHGFSELYDGPGLTKATGNWTAKRPQFTAGDDWLADAVAAHQARWAVLGRTCGRSSCDICPDGAAGA